MDKHSVDNATPMEGVSARRPLPRFEPRQSFARWRQRRRLRKLEERLGLHGRKPYRMLRRTKNIQIGPLPWWPGPGSGPVIHASCSDLLIGAIVAMFALQNLR